MVVTSGREICESVKYRDGQTHDELTAIYDISGEMAREIHLLSAVETFPILYPEKLTFGEFEDYKVLRSSSPGHPGGAAVARSVGEFGYG